MNGWRIFNRISYFIGSLIFCSTILHAGIMTFQLEESICYYLIFTLGMLCGFTFIFINRRKRVRDTVEAKNKTTQINKAFDSLEKHYVFQEKLLENMFTMVDNIHGMAMWIKDENDRYMFADRTLRTLLLSGRPMNAVIGKTDADLALRDSCNTQDLEELMKDLKMCEYPQLSSSLFENKLVCNITDVITRLRKTPCRFYEEIGPLSLDVWKTPVLSSDGAVQGTVGCLVNVSKDRSLWQHALQRAARKGLVFKIDGTPQYILKDYGFEINLFQKNFEDIIEAYEIEKDRLTAQLNTITSACSDAIVVVNRVGKITFWNPMAEQLFGYSKTDVMSKDIFDFLIPEKYKEATLADFEKFKKLEANRILRSALKIKANHKDGSSLCVSVSLAVTKIEEDCSIIGIIRPTNNHNLEEFECETK